MSTLPSHFRLELAIRKNVLELEPYVCARDEYKVGVLLDANENSLGHALPTANSAVDDTFDNLDLHRYPDPNNIELKQLFCDYRSVTNPNMVFLGVGSDEVIDLLFRITCVPAKDRVLICPPTYGMYAVCAKLNDVPVIKIPLDCEEAKFTIQIDEINNTLSAAAKTDSPIKLVFLCSPGNPTGTQIPLDSIRKVLSNPDFNGLVVVDEAYIDFTEAGTSAVELLVKEGWSNLVIMQTLSKGFGLAAIRLGIAYASAPIIQILNNVKAPYSISTPTALLASRALSKAGLTLLHTKIEILKSTHQSLKTSLLALPNVIETLGAGNANFILARIGTNGLVDDKRAKAIYLRMAQEMGVVVRYRGGEVGCLGCLRITVGTEEECEILLKKLAEVLKD